MSINPVGCRTDLTQICHPITQTLIAYSVNILDLCFYYPLIQLWYFFFLLLLPYKFYLYIFVYYYNKVGPANLSCNKKPEKFASPIGKDMNMIIEITKQLARFAK